jgi:hypothetical protein
MQEVATNTYILGRTKRQSGFMELQVKSHLIKGETRHVFPAVIGTLMKRMKCEAREVSQMLAEMLRKGNWSSNASYWSNPNGSQRKTS